MSRWRRQLHRRHWVAFRNKSLSIAGRTRDGKTHLFTIVCHERGHMEMYVDDAKVDPTAFDGIMRVRREPWRMIDVLFRGGVDAWTAGTEERKP